MEQKWPSHLVIVRHGESGRNVSKEIAKSKGEHLYGSDVCDIDVSLTERGALGGSNSGSAPGQEVILT